MKFTKRDFDLINGQHERGFATIVFIMLVGLAITATGTGVMHSVKSTQQMNIAVNSVTHAQTGVWVGAEAFRRYLSELDSTGLTSLVQEVSIGMDPSYGNLIARNIQVSDMGSDTYRVSADVVNTHAAARSSAALNVVYEVQPGGATSGGLSPADPIVAVNFNDDLNLSGNLTLIGADGGKFDLNVNGDVELGGASTNPLGTISATGNVTLGSSVSVENIYANDDVELNNTTVNTVSTLEDFKGSNATVEQVFANGDVTIQNGGRFELVYSLKNIMSSTNAGLGYVNAGETVTVQYLPVDRLEAVGDVLLNTDRRVDEVVSMEDITCVGNYWKEFTSLSANGSLYKCNTSSNVTQSGASRTVTPMTPLKPYTMTAPTIDVWTIQSAANYIVGYDSVQGRITVKVNNVSGIDDESEYVIGNYNNYNGSSAYKDYLCESVDGAGNCTAPSEPLIPLCIGQSIYNGCIVYSASNNTFTVNPNTTAPGIMWFDGNLILGNGFGMTTYLATGDVETTNSYKSWSANYAGYDKICLADGSHIGKGSEVENRYTQVYSEHYPNNLCDIANGLYLSDATGNIGLAAGGIDPSGDGSYSGGDIKLGASTEVTGAVLAGNLLSTVGDTTVYGAVASSAAGASNSNANSLGSRTTIDMSRGNSTYDPSNIPDMGGDSSGSGGSETNESVSRMLWVRYF